MNSKILVIMIMVVLLLSGCSLEENEKKEEIANINDFPKMYCKSYEHLKFESEIIIRAKNNNILYECVAKPNKFNHKSAIELLFPKEQNSQIQSDGNNYVHSNGNTLYINKDYLSFNSNSSEMEQALEQISLEEDRNKAKGVEKLDELKAHTIERELEKLKIDQISFYKSHEEAKNSAGEKSYYWLGNQSYQELPVFNTTLFAGINDTWAPIQILSTANGIEKLQVLYNYSFEKKDNKIELKSFDQIALALEKEYSMILGDNKRVVSRAELFFWVDVNQESEVFQMIPTWVLNVKEFSQSSLQWREYQELVNAETAEVMEVGE